jgi:hypothetical protein
LLSDFAYDGQASEVSGVVLGSENILDNSRAMRYNEIFVCEQITSFWILSYVRWHGGGVSKINPTIYFRPDPNSIAKSKSDDNRRISDLPIMGGSDGDYFGEKESLNLDSYNLTSVVTYTAS